MSDIYLTKIERKTIFTRSLIFVLITFLICDLTVTGPFYFNFIPWIYIIGIICEIRKIDKVLMGIITTFTVFVSTIIVNGTLNMTALINTIVALVLLVFGIITGRIIREFILEHRLVKYIKPSKKVLYIISAILLLVVSYGIVAIKDGNVFEYISSRKKLDSYIEKTYGVSNYTIKEVKYNKKTVTKYIYKVNLDGVDIELVPIDAIRFKDLNMDERLSDANYDLEIEFNDKLATIHMEQYEFIQDIITRIEVEYSGNSLLPDKKIIYISLNGVDYSKENEKKIYIELASFINKILSLEDVEKIVLELNDNSMEISKDKFESVTDTYLEGGFVIEELDGSWGLE